MLPSLQINAADHDAAILRRYDIIEETYHQCDRVEKIKENIVQEQSSTEFFGTINSS